MKLPLLLFCIGIFLFQSVFTQEFDSVRTIKVVGVGDIMLGTNFPSVKYLPPDNDCWPLLEEVSPVLNQADICFGNLEGSFLDWGPLEKNCKDTTKCYAFRMPNSYAECISAAGFNLLSLANNHTFDFGDTAVLNTSAILDSLGIRTAGTTFREYDTITVNNTVVGLIAFAPNKGCLQITETNNAIRLVKELDKIADIIIVSFHGGAEGKEHQHITRETEEYYGENRGNVYEFSHSMIDAGADVVFGHGPHITRAIEVYKDRFIAYSLGNFSTYARFNLSGPNGIAPIIDLDLDTNGTFVKGKIHAVYQKGEGGARLDPYNRVIAKLQQLTYTDLPEMKDVLIIEDDGRLTLKR